MRKLTDQFNFGKNNKISAVLAMLIVSLIVLACSGGAEKPAAPPSESEAQALVKKTLSDFADMIDKGDFNAFKANTSKEFQSQFSDEKMKTSFQSFIDQKEIVVPILRDAAKKNAVFSPAPAVREEQGYSVLNTTGTIDSEPQPLKVNNDYVYQDGKWKLLKVGVNLE
jgi:hypothetical protein